MKIKIVKCEFKENFGDSGKSYTAEWTQEGSDEIQKGKSYKQFIVGQTCDVNITADKMGIQVIKDAGAKKPFYGGGAKKLDEYRIAGFAMSYAKDIAIAKIQSSDAPYDINKELPKMAESIYNWIKAHKV